MKKKLFRHVVIGYWGEVGQCVFQFLKDSKNSIDVRGVDIATKNKGLSTIQKVGVPSELLLHVCIPYSRKFIKIVKKYIETYNPYATIVYSTVPPGTCRKLGVTVIHSPIEGRHPNLLEAFRIFTRFLGSSEHTDLKKLTGIIKFFKDNKLNVVFLFPQEVTELGKLLSTTRYGVSIAFCDEMQEMCNKYQVAYDSVVTLYQAAYNQLYKKLGCYQYIQPSLFPPRGIIKGHCIVQNSQLMVKNKIGGKMTQIVAEFNNLPWYLKAWSWLGKVISLFGGKK